MKVASHHIPENLLQAYVCGTLPHPFSVVVAAHVSLCDECRAYMEALEVLGGAVVDRLEPATVSQGLRERVLSQLDDFEPMSDSPSRSRPEGIYPGPVMAALGGNAPRWRPLGGGIRQQVLDKSPEGSLRLLYIPPGMAVPEHGHSGLEMTLVLQGSFHDGRNCYQVGDVEVEDDDGCDHKPQAGPGDPCICLAATDSPLRFTGMLPRLIQPLLGI